MTKLVRCREISVQNNIKNEFKIILLTGEMKYEYHSKIFPASLIYSINLQNEILEEHGTDAQEIVKYIFNQIEYGEIPARFAPIIEKRKIKEIFVVYYNSPPLKMKVYCGKYKTHAGAKGNITRMIKRRSWSEREYSIEVVNVEIGEATIKNSIIPLLKLKGMDKRIINALVEFTKEVGNCTFEEYIDEWVDNVCSEDLSEIEKGLQK